MTTHEPAWLEKLRLRWTQPNPNRFLRPDGHRFIRPDGDRFLRHDHARFDPLGALARKYSPDQPRVPAGNADGGQWTGGGAARLASSEKPRPGPEAIGVIAAEVAKRLIENYRKDNNLRDLFGRDRNTVTVTTIDGKDIFGSNSTSPTYDNLVDRPAASRLRDALIEKYPDIMKTENIGEKPNDAIYHAETTVLLRAARENGGTLAGRTLEVRGDRPMCESCEKVLPYIGLELGNPTVTYIDSTGRQRTMNNGSWVK